MKKYDLFITEREYNKNGSLRKKDKQLCMTVNSVAEARKIVKNYNNDIGRRNQNDRVKDSVKRKEVNQYGWYNYTTSIASYKKHK